MSNPSKVHTKMLEAKVLEDITYAFPLLTFRFTDGTAAILNLVTWAFIPAASV